jgi:ABC-type cobalamin/Fe3+-siderophores transport system ATPase subunit
MLKSLVQRKERSVIVSMHDLNLASNFSDWMRMLRYGSIYAVVAHESVLMEKNIEAVYGIKADVSTSVIGKPQVTPLVAGHHISLFLKLSQIIEEKQREVKRHGTN